MGLVDPVSGLLTVGEKAIVEYIQSILDNFVLYNSFLNHGQKSRYWINQDILYGNKNLGGFNAIRVSDFILSLKTSWMHRYAVAKVNDHWCDQLDTILGVDYITREDFLHWGSAKWGHTLNNKNAKPPNLKKCKIPIL